MTGGVVGYAFALGMIGLLNPCGFPLLPIYLTVFVETVDRRWGSRSLGALRAGAALTIGFLAVFAVAAAVIASLHGLIEATAPWIMLAVSAGIIVFGGWGLAGRTFSIRSAPRFRTGRAFLAMIGFGIAYAIGSLSCTLPVFVAAVSGALATSSTLGIAATVTAYGLGMGLFAVVAALVVSWADAAALRVLRPIASFIPRVAGGLCILIGVYLLASWGSRIGAPDIAAPVTRVLDRLQSAASSLIEAVWMPLGAALVVMVLTVLIVAAVRARTAAAVVLPAEQAEERKTGGIAE
ncbi:cytochrome c biogenesis CcdA family protein [Microbacterium sp. MMO-10]|uniref:cytochrome c biogenesis CcdA family protein n=1 Tax=Microbacterium sp. MMO-10 TaxID=3081272 RepID=UPI0030185F4A